MSDALGLVKFEEDWKIMFCKYNGWSDSVYNNLWETHEELNLHWREGSNYDKHCEH